MRSKAVLGLASLFLSLSVHGQNLVTGGDFATGLAAWHHDPNTRGTSDWSEHDEVDSPLDGSAQLVSTAAETGVFVALLEQCVPVAAGQQYVLSHKARFADAQTTTGWAETEVSWFSGPICTNRISAVGDVDAPGSGGSVTGALVCPILVDRFRYNVGLRTVGAPVHVNVRLRDSSGVEIHSVAHDYPADYFIQSTVSDFLDGFAIGDGQWLEITFSGGGLIIYGATIDNTTNDPSAQFMPYLFAIA